MTTSASKSESSYIFFWKVSEHPYGIFSQWWSSPTSTSTHQFTFDSKSFATAEQFMMYCKALIFRDSTMADTILTSIDAHPSEHKKLGRQVQDFDKATWDRLCMNVVVIANLCKFSQSAELAKLLLETGDREIVEASPRDRIWGIGFGEKGALRPANRGRWGQNKLGKALMIVRRVMKKRREKGLLGPVEDTAECARMKTEMGVEELDAMEVFG